MLADLDFLVTIALKLTVRLVYKPTHNGVGWALRDLLHNTTKSPVLLYNFILE